MADGTIKIDTKIDNTGIEKGIDAARKEVAKLAAEYKKAGMSASDAMKKAWQEVEYTSKKGSKNVVGLLDKINDFKFTDLLTSFKDAASGVNVLGVNVDDLTEGFSKGGLKGAALTGIVTALATAFIQLATQAIAKAIEMLKQFVAMSIQTASSVQESINVLNVVFDTNKVQAWAETTATAFNMSTDEAMKFAGVMGGMLTPSGLGMDTIEDMSIVLTQLSGDLGSLWNTTNEQAFNALRSGISGELEPLRQFGVNMTVANLETYAFANGVNKAWNELSQAEQTLIRYNYILENTRTAQGDVARSADSYAYATKQLELALSNVGQGFGEQLLPGLTRIKEVVADFLETNKDTIEFIGAITGTVVNMVGGALKFLETLLKPVQGILNLVSKAATGLLNVLNEVLDAWINFWDSVFSTSEDTLNKMGYDLQDLNQLMEDLNIDSVSSFEDMYNKIQSLSGDHYDKLKEMASNYNDEYKAQQGALDDYVSDGVKERMREVEKEYEGRDKTANDYMKLARIEANEKRRLEDEVSKHRTKLDNEYMGKLKTELAQQQTFLAQQNTLRKSKYLEDVREYEKAEKEKTKIFKEQDKQRIRENNSSRSENNSSRSENSGSIRENNSSRNGNNSSISENSGSRSENNSSRNGNNSSISSRSGSSTGLLSNVGRSLTAYSVGNMSTTSTNSSNSTYNFNVQGLSVEQILSYAKQKNRLRG